VRVAVRRRRLRRRDVRPCALALRRARTGACRGASRPAAGRHVRRLRLGGRQLLPDDGRGRDPRPRRRAGAHDGRRGDLGREHARLRGAPRSRLRSDRCANRDLCGRVCGCPARARLVRRLAAHGGEADAARFEGPGALSRRRAQTARHGEPRVEVRLQLLRCAIRSAAWRFVEARQLLRVGDQVDCSDAGA